MATELAAANALFVDGDYEAALARYDAAVAAQPDSAEALIKRAACSDKLGRHDAALKDADAAIALMPTSSSAHHHRGTALLHLERYVEARKALREAQRLLGGGAAHTSLLGVIKAQLAEVKEKEELQREAPEGVAHVAKQQRETTATTAGGGAGAGRQAPGVGEVSDAVAAVSLSSPAATTATTAPAATTTTVAANAGGGPRPPRYDWYQSLSHVTVTLWVKAPVEDACSILVADQRLEASLTSADGGVHSLALRLYAGISPDAPMTVSYRPTKVEVRMPKAAPGMWPCLTEGGAAAGGGGGAVAVPPATAALPSAAAAATTTTTGGGVPSAYSSGKDWSKVEKALGAEAADAAEDESSLEGFFKGLYARADEDSRRAMIKSYVSGRVVLWSRAAVACRRRRSGGPVRAALSLSRHSPRSHPLARLRLSPQTESGGLSLSTDWKQVGKKDFAEEGRRLAAEPPPPPRDDEDA
jgi:hypothetical protein